MSLKRIKNNLGFLLAGVILIGVVANVYMELKGTGVKEPTCQSISTQ
jgi:hypothetical protein